MDIVSLNVGGVIFKTTKATLTRGGSNYFASLFSAEKRGMTPKKDENGCYFVDRSGELFQVILEYLRTNKLRLGEWKEKEDEIMDELEFYSIPIPPARVFPSLIREQKYWIQVVPFFCGHHNSLLGWNTRPRRARGHIPPEQIGQDDMLLAPQYGPSNHSLERKYMISAAEIVNFLQTLHFIPWRFDPVQLYSGENKMNPLTPHKGASFWMYKPILVDIDVASNEPTKEDTPGGDETIAT